MGELVAVRQVVKQNSKSAIEYARDARNFEVCRALCCGGCSVIVSQRKIYKRNL